MPTDRNTPEGVDNWLIQSSTNPWSFPSIVGPELTREMLQHICCRWSSYPLNIKLGVLFAFLCIRKVLLSSMGNELAAIITNGCNDNDEWVRLVSKMLQNYPSTGTLDLNIEQYISQDALQNLTERIQQTGVKYHPTEYAFIDRCISDTFQTLSINAEAPCTSTSHFILRQETDMSREQRLNVAVTPPPSPRLTSPVNATGSDQNRVCPTATSTGPSLFISKHRPSQLAQPFHMSLNPQKLRPTNIFGGSDSPTEPKITQGKKYVKPTKIQMLDITTATTITRNQEETKLKSQIEEQQQIKEARKQEREKQKEKRCEKEGKKQKEHEKNERIRQKEENRLTKEREKREKATAKVAVAVPDEINDTQPINVPDGETIEEETVSDGELPHKDPASFISSLSTNPHQSDERFPSTNNHNTIIISQNGSSSNLTNTSIMQAATTELLSSAAEQTMVADLEQPRLQFEEIPRNEMSKELREQFEMNCGAVLDNSNKIHGDIRQLIINFLGGHHTKPEQREKLMSISNGVTCNEDEIRHIILHETKTPIPNEGKEIQENFVFEMNLSNGYWRKIKRRKIKTLKNQKLETLNGSPNGKFPGQ